MSLSCQGDMAASCRYSDRNRKYRAHISTTNMKHTVRKQEVRRGFKLSNTTLSEIFPPTKQYLLNFPKQCQQLGGKFSEKGVDRGNYSFKPPHWNCCTMRSFRGWGDDSVGKSTYYTSIWSRAHILAHIQTLGMAIHACNSSAVEQGDHCDILAGSLAPDSLRDVFVKKQGGEWQSRTPCVLCSGLTHTQKKSFH